MSGTLRLRGSTSGYSELQAPAVAADQTFVLPTAGGTLLTTDSPVPKLTLELGSASQPSLTFQGDTDTGLFSEGTNTLNLVTGGSSKVVLGAAAHTIYAGTGATVRAIDIDSTGNVGIGTSSPGSYNAAADNLVIYENGNSGISIVSSTTNAGSIFFADGTSGDAQYRGSIQYSHNDDKLYLGAAGGTSITIDSSNQVGIGTTSPNFLLDVVGTSGSSSVAEFSYTGGNSVFLKLANASNTQGFIGYETQDLTFYTNNSEKARIDTSGRLLVNKSSAGSVLTTTIELAGAGAGSLQPAYQVYAYPGTSNDDTGYFQFFRSRGASVGTNTIVAPNDRLGMLRWAGADGTDYVAAAEIFAEVDGTPGSNNMPGRLVFSTTAGGASSTTERMRINSVGEVGIGKVPDSNYILDIEHPIASTTVKLELKTGVTTGYNTIQFRNDANKNAYVWQNGSNGPANFGGSNAMNVVNYDGPLLFGAGTTGGYTERMRLLTTGGLTFNGDTAQANALDDYEEGTFSPDVRGTTTSGIASYSHRHGKYVKVGQLVHIQMYLAWTSGTGAGSLEIHNLPFTANSVNTAYGGVSVGYWHNIPLSANYYPQLFTSYNNNFIHCYQAPTGGGSSIIVPYSATGGGLILAATYRSV